MRRPTGFATIIDPDRPPIERDTTTCNHCGCVIFTKPNSAATVYLILDRRTLHWQEEAGAFCRVCMRPVCLSCHDHGTCRPWEKALEAAEARDRLRRSVGG